MPFNVRSMTRLNQYLNGEITEEEMWATWKDSLRIEFPDLIIK